MYVYIMFISVRVCMCVFEFKLALYHDGARINSMVKDFLG